MPASMSSTRPRVKASSASGRAAWYSLSMANIRGMPRLAIASWIAWAWSRRISSASQRWRSSPTASSGGSPPISARPASNCRYSLTGTATSSDSHSFISVRPASVIS